MPDGLVAAAAIARQGRAGRQMFAPIDALDGLVDALGTRRIDGSQTQQHPGGGARPQACPVTDFERALKFYIVAALANIFGAKLGKFLGQHRSGAHGRGRHPIADVVVHAQCTAAELAARKSCHSSWG